MFTLARVRHAGRKHNTSHTVTREHWGGASEWTEDFIVYLFIILTFLNQVRIFFFSFLAAPMAYGSSQAGDQTRDSTAS